MAKNDKFVLSNFKFKEVYLNKFRHFYLNKYIVSLFKKQYPICYDYKHKALWFRVRKAATTTIKTYFLENTEKNEYIYSSEIGYLPRMFKGYFKFAFVRNPLDRFMSCWQDKVVAGNYFNYSPKVYEKMLDINNFITWVETLNIKTCDQHLREQSSLIDLNNIDFIGRIENFENDFIYVCNQIGMKTKEIYHKNKSKIEIEISDEAKARIMMIYKRDFNIFNYN